VEELDGFGVGHFLMILTWSKACSLYLGAVGCGKICDSDFVATRTI